MGGIASALFGGGQKKAAAEAASARAAAAAEAEKSRQAQAIANDRQLAQLNADDERTATSRRAPRGRRLFSADAAEGGLASTLGG